MLLSIIGMMFRDIIVKNCLDILLQINKTQLLVLSLIQLSCQSHNLAGFCLFYPKRTRTTGESISGQIFCIVESFVKEGDSLIYRINLCRVQTARKNKGMPFRLISIFPPLKLFHAFIFQSFTFCWNSLSMVVVRWW